MKSRIQEAKDLPGGLVFPGLDTDAPYSSKLSARSALYTDLQLLLDDRPEALTAEEYRRLVLDANCLSRGSSVCPSKDLVRTAETLPSRADFLRSRKGSSDPLGRLSPTY
jgi:hypothetical protein